MYLNQYYKPTILLNNSGAMIIGRFMQVYWKTLLSGVPQ
jgi:hypothetical protein